MNILICNDDGINSEGIIVLAKCLSREHNVLVVAPDGNRSAFSHSLTISANITVREVFIDEAFRSYAISGTPADCVKFAHHVFSDFKIDLVCAGINAGSNLGTDTMYSGTVSAGLEANCLGLPAIAFSSTSFGGNNWEECVKVAYRVFNLLLNKVSPSHTFNVNIPNVAGNAVKGVKFTPLGVQIYTDRYELVGENVYRLVGDPIEHDNNQEDCDVEWNLKNYVTVTPVRYDKTDYNLLKNFPKEIDL